MNKLIIIPFLFLIIGCATKETQQETITDTTPIPIFLNYDPPGARHINEGTEEPYKIEFKIETSEDKKHSLIIAMKLEEGSFYVSPFAVRDFKGKFSVSLEENDYLDLGHEFTETPRSEEIFDPHPFVNGEVNWVKVNTTYEHQLEILKKEDFEVKGVVRFVIEPRCTLEEIPFMISSKSGKMNIQGLDGC